MLHEEQMEEKCEKDQKEIWKRIEEVERQDAKECKADRTSRSERDSKRGPAVLRKQDPKLLGRENIPGALSKAPP